MTDDAFRNRIAEVAWASRPRPGGAAYQHGGMSTADAFLAMPEMQEIKEFISRMANGPSAAMRGRRLLKVWGLSDSVIDWALDEEEDQ